MGSPQWQFTRVPLDAEGIPQSDENSYEMARKQVTDFLIRYTLRESHDTFVRLRQPYPFVSRTSLRPGAVTSTKEYTLHNNALVIMVDGTIPSGLRKHFRYREGNRVNKRNILSVAPELPMENYDRGMRMLRHGRFEEFFRLMLPLDYALVIQRDAEEEDTDEHGYGISHFHVKIERLTDNALRDIGVHLNFLERHIFEHGEAFIEELEKKFFEYFNFYHNAAGRRSAAALSAQLLGREGLRSTVFIASQQDRRLTLLSTNGRDEEVSIEQFLLLKMEKEELQAFKLWGKKEGINVARHYLISQQRGAGVAVLRVRYTHTAAGKPSPDGSLKTFNFRERWIRLAEEVLVPVVDSQVHCVGHPVTYPLRASRRVEGDDEVTGEL